MLRLFDGLLFERRRSRPGEILVGLALLGLILLFLAAPLATCPCGGRPAEVPLAPPTPDLYAFKWVPCASCKGSGRTTLYERWFGRPPSGATPR